MSIDEGPCNFINISEHTWINKIITHVTGYWKNCFISVNTIYFLAWKMIIFTEVDDYKDGILDYCH